MAQTHKQALIHHFLCAYVGLTSDFERNQQGRICPKCLRPLSANKKDWDVLGRYRTKSQQ